MFLIRIFLGLVSSASLFGASLGPTTEIAPVTSGVFPCYNSQNNEFLVAFVNNDVVNIAIYGPNGNEVVTVTSIVTDVNPYSAVYTSYNSHLNQYFLSWYEYSSGPVFMILDAQGEVIKELTTMVTSIDLVGNVVNCYNSQTNQYLITWVTGSLVPKTNHFAIFNEDGTLFSGPNLIPNTGSLSSYTTQVSCAYNNIENNYIFTWGGSDLNPYFAIYNQEGSPILGTTVISDIHTLVNSKGVFNSYNSKENQYFITWVSGGFIYFIIYDSEGTVVTPPMQIDNIIGAGSANSVYSTYNSVDDGYFIGQQGEANIWLNICDHTGAFLSKIEIPYSDSYVNFSDIFSAYNQNLNQCFVSWWGFNGSISNGYFAIYSGEVPILPPSNLTGSKNHNQFGFFFEIYNKLNWSAPEGSASPIVSYNIYRNGILIATTSADTTSYQDHNQPNIAVVYEVATEDSNGNVSARASVIVF